MKTPKLLLVVALSATCFAIAPLGAQPLPTERALPKINNLSLKLVAPDVAEKLAMPAKPIVLKLDNVTLETALRELETQSGVKLDLGYGGKEMLNKKLSLDFETPFFSPAFDAILDEAGVQGSLQRYGRNDAYNVQFGRDDDENGAPPQAGMGPFQVKLRSVESNFRETVKPNTNGEAVRSQRRSFSLSIDGKPDPIVDVTGTPLVILRRVEDDKGRSLLDKNEDNWLRYDFDDDWYGVRPQSIQNPAANAKNLARVEGTAIYVVPTARVRWEIAHIIGKENAAHQFESDGRTVTANVKSATRQDRVVNVNFEMSAPPTGDEGDQTNPLFSFGQIGKAIHLEDKNGNVFRLGGSTSTTSGNKLTLRGEFIAANNRRAMNEDDKRAPVQIAEPIKLVFDGPTEWVQTEVPFSFENVPLP